METQRATLTEEVLADAREWKPAALDAVFTAGYAPARRIAHALSGDDRVAAAVAELLLRQSVRLLPRWRDPSTAENWFYHHAVLITRGANAPPPPDPSLDPLVVHGPAAVPAYLAFIRTLRLLPPQQREAFVLHHGERLNARMLGVAMDCSVSAAQTHLDAATKALREMSGGAAADVDALAAELSRAYAHLSAAQPPPAHTVRVYVRRVRRRIWVRRLMRAAVVAALLAGAGVLIWLFRDEILRRMR
jgi:DNA-directed RNA polymerase specialized sigma24 family protein